MKAWVLHGIDDLKLETVETPKPASGEVLVSVKAAGICGSDIPRIFRTGTYSYPLIPGHEFSGVVAKTGEGVDIRWQGQRVGIFPLLPCHFCLPCQRRQYEMCRNYGYLGSRQNGGFAEYVVAPVQNLLKLPDGVSFEEAAMLEPMAVAVHAIRRAKPSTEDTIAICGLGTIGLLVLMLLLEKRKGKFQNAGRILVIGNKEFQKQTVLRMGLSEDCYCDSKKEDAGKWLMEKTHGKGVNMFFECVGKNETLAQAVCGAGPGGKVLLVGNPGSDMELEKQVYWKILRNQLEIIGTWNSSFTKEAEDDWHYALDRMEHKRIAPAELITHKFALDELNKGLYIMKDRTEDFIKIMSVMKG